MNKHQIIKAVTLFGLLVIAKFLNARGRITNDRMCCLFFWI